MVAAISPALPTAHVLNVHGVAHAEASNNDSSSHNREILRPKAMFLRLCVGPFVECEPS
jgi:hypothetical protein